MRPEAGSISKRIWTDKNECLIILVNHQCLWYNSKKETIIEGVSTLKKPRGDNQAKILAFIKSEVLSKGYPPSVREICDAVGLRSTSTVHGHLMRLEKKGLLHRDSMKPRAMEVVDFYEERMTAAAQTQNVTSIPIVGSVTAGVPILAEENIDEYLPLPNDLLGDGEHFLLRVRGESMINAGILDDDYIIVHKQAEARNGDIVVALIEDEATVKRFYKEDGHFRLQPENDTMDPIIVKDLSVLGKVVSLIRRF